MRKYIFPIILFFIVLWGISLGSEYLIGLVDFFQIILTNFLKSLDHLWTTFVQHITHQPIQIFLALIITLIITMIHRKSTSSYEETTLKSKWLAILLAFFTGFLGVHRFYLNQYGYGITYLVILLIFLPIGIPMTFILGLIDAVRYLLMTNEEFQAKYTR